MRRRRQFMTRKAQILPSLPLNNIVASYPFENNANDTTGINNGVTDNVTYVSGKVGNAANFNGSSSDIIINDPDVLSFTSGGSDIPFSISFYINFNSVTSTQLFLNKTSASDREWEVRFDATYMRFYVYQNPTTWQAAYMNNNRITINQWHHIVCTYDGRGLNAREGMNYYLDGVFIGRDGAAASNTYTGTTNTNANVNIGQFHTGTLRFNGIIDELFFWDVELNQNQVTDLYNLQRDGVNILL